MQNARAVVSTAIADSPRVQLLGGMFDLGIPAQVERTFEASLPGLQEDWRIGCIVGPSGSGKSSIARAAYGKALWTAPAWPAKKAIVDCFGDIEVRKITGMLTAVGFSSPPAWIRPFATLSNGEQFRANLAKALLSKADLVAYDEFTSVVDRTVAQIGSAAVAKSIRKGVVKGRFVAVTCHYDILPWLQPDWVLDTSDWTVSRRALRRPEIRLEVRRCLPDLWAVFKTHHYLSASLCLQGLRSFACLHEGQAIAFAAILPCPGLAGARRVSRIVVLPDWQGIGVGRAFCRGLGELYLAENMRLYLRTSHTMMIRSLSSDPCWGISGVHKFGSVKSGGQWAVRVEPDHIVEFSRLGRTVRRKVPGGLKGHQVSSRPGVSFVYLGGAAP